jgi:hypothetical protein
MLRHSGHLARELFQDILAEPTAVSRVYGRADAVVLVREKREAGIQDLAFGARPFILCGLPIRRLPAGSLTCTRRNGRLFLEIVGHPEFGQDRLTADWLAHSSEFSRARSSSEPATAAAVLKYGTAAGLTSSIMFTFGSAKTGRQEKRERIW